jgi:hypothetical protein
MPRGNPLRPKPLGSSTTGWLVTFQGVNTLGFCQKEMLRQSASRGASPRPAVTKASKRA